MTIKHDNQKAADAWCFNDMRGTALESQTWHPSNHSGYKAFLAGCARRDKIWATGWSVISERLREDGYVFGPTSRALDAAAKEILEGGE